MNLMRRHIAIPLVLLTLSACAPGDDEVMPGSEGGTPVGGGSFTVAEIGDMDKPLPLIYSNSTDGDVIDMTYMSLMSPIWENGELIYQTAAENELSLARSYELFGPDSASLRYRMRSDVRWSDGTPITAHDAKWTIDTRGNPATASPRQDYNRQIRSVEVENDSTLVIHFTRRYPEMLFHTAGNVVPKHVYEGTEPSQLRSHPSVLNPGGGALVVSGPYMISEWLRGERVVLVPNPQFQPPPYIQRIVLRPIPEEATRIIELQTAGVDVMEIPFSQIQNVKTSAPHVRFEYQRRRFYDYIAYNPRTVSAFADKDIRRALGLAIDVPELIQALNLSDLAEPAGGPYTPIFKDLADPVGQAPLPYDPAEAGRILDSKGWVPGPDGIRAKGGQRLSFSLISNTGNQRRADIAQIVQQKWRAIGVEANVSTLESVTFFDRLTKKELEAAIGGWSVGLAADISDQWSGDNVFNYTSYDNPEVMRLFEQALAQPTEELAAPYWRQAAAGIVADQPYTWLFFFDQVVGVNDRIRGTRIDTLGKFQNVHEWWIPAELQNDAAAGAGN